MGNRNPLPLDQGWQSELWRLIQSHMPAPEQKGSRARLHRRFLKAIPTLRERPQTLPRRIIIFGISTLPRTGP